MLYSSVAIWLLEITGKRRVLLIYKPKRPYLSEVHLQSHTLNILLALLRHNNASSRRFENEVIRTSSANNEIFYVKDYTPHDSDTKNMCHKSILFDQCKVNIVAINHLEIDDWRVALWNYSPFSGYLILITMLLMMWLRQLHVNCISW